MRVLVYDSTAGFLSTLWSIGRFLSKWDLVIAAKSWEHAIDEMLTLGEPVEELQFWGHGTAGGPLINGAPVTKYRLVAIKDACRFSEAENPFIWWRACDVFSRAAGVDFALAAVETTGCAHVGHTRVISAPWPFLQSGGYGLRPGEKVKWDEYEGVTKEGLSKGSHPFAPNTCLVTTMSVPERWWS